MASNDGWEDVPVAAHDSAWEDVPVEHAKEEPSGWQSAIKGLQNVPTMGLGNHLGALEQAALLKLSGDPSSFGENYRHARDENVQEDKAAREAHPGAYFAAGAPAALALPGVSALGEAGMAARLGNAALTGAGYGAIQGAADSSGDLTKGDFGQVAKDALAGASLGAALGGTGGLGGEAISKLAGSKGTALESAAEDAGRGLQEKIQGYADQRAAKSIGATKSNFKGLDMDDIERHGANLRDMGIPLTGSPQAKAAAVEAKLQENGAAIGQMLQKADDSNAVFQAIPKGNDLAEAAPGLGIRTKPLPPKQGGFDMTDFAQQARQQILPRMEGDPALASEYRKATRMLDGYERLGSVPYSKANQLKANLQSTINFASPKSQQDVANQLQGIFLDQIDRGIGQDLGDAAHSQFKALKSQYGSLKWAKGVLDQQAIPGAVGNRTHGLTDYISGGIGATVGHAVGGPIGSAAGAAIGIGANKLAREYAPGMLAQGLNKVAKTNLAPNIYKSMGKVGDLLQTAPQVLGKYGGALTSIAEQHGPDAAAAAHFVMSQTDPEYQALAQKGDNE